MTNEEMDTYVRFREISPDAILPNGRGENLKNRKCRWEIFIEEFIQSEFRAAEIEIAEGKKACNERANLKAYLKKHGFLDMFELITRSGHLYIINKDVVSGKRKRKPFNKKPTTKKKRRMTPEENCIGYAGVYRGAESAEVDRIG